MPITRLPDSVRPSRALATAALVVAAALLASHPIAAQSPDASRGVAAFEQGDLARARTELDAVLRQNPRDTTALYYEGRIAMQQDRSGDAVDCFEKAIKVSDRNVDLHVSLGAALADQAMRASKFRQPFLARRVKSEFERAVALAPRNLDARQALLQFYAVAPGFLGGNMDRARQEASEIARISPLAGHLATAYLAMRDKNDASAEHEYEAAITAAPDSAVGYISLGALQQRLQRWDEAFATYDRLLKRHPGTATAQYQIGRTAAVSGRNLERGETTLKVWLAQPPKDASSSTIAGAHYRLGQIYEKTGRRDAARTEYQEALRINPKHEDAKKSLAALG